MKARLLLQILSAACLLLVAAFAGEATKPEKDLEAESGRPRTAFGDLVPEPPKGIAPSYFTDELLHAWVEAQGDKPLKWPSCVKNRHNTGFYIDKLHAPALLFFPYLQHLHDQGIRPKDRDKFMLEMTEWLLTDDFSLSITAGTMLELEFPDLDPMFNKSELAMSKEEKQAIAEKVRGLLKARKTTPTPTKLPQPN